MYSSITVLPVCYFFVEAKATHAEYIQRVEYRSAV
jgi:hypothetical protein